MSTPPKAPQHHIVPSLAQGTRTLYRTETEQGTSVTATRTVAAGHESYLYEIHIDQEALRGLIGRAANNKTGRAKAGPVLIKITNRISNQ